MNKLNYVASILLGGIVITIFGCKGDTGAQGPTGTSGTGASISVYTYTIPAASWAVNANYPWEIDCTLSTGGITTNGAMECYYSPDSANYLQLPWISNGNPPFYEQSWVYNTSGTVQVRWYSVASNPGAPPTPPANSYFKVVSIPQEAITRYPNTNWSNWGQVSQVITVQKAQQN